jgi:hypothetical protein
MSRTQAPENTRKATLRPRETRTKKVGVAKIPRAADGKFLRGVSGNPGGRPRIAEEVRELAGAHSVEALMIAVEIMRDRKKDPSTRLAASRTVLDRAVGKPAQLIGGANGQSLVNITMGAIVTAEDAARAYREMCLNPGYSPAPLLEQK